MKPPPTLVSRHSLWLAGSFAVLTLWLIVMFSALVAWPMAHRAADDLAGLMVLSAQTWVELPPQTRDAFTLELRERHGLELRPATPDRPRGEWHAPLVWLLEDALNRRLEMPTHLHREVVDGEVWYWINLPVGQRGLAVGLPRDRYNSQPLVLLATGLLASLLLAWSAARWLAVRMAAPVARLEQAMAVIGQGRTPQPLAEAGPQELAHLSRHFNTMVGQVNELMSTRTTLLAGISHDLRTPLARMRLAVEIMREQPQAQAQMLDRLDAEIARTNHLIGEVLDLARGLAHEPPEAIELRPLLERLAQDYATPDTPVRVDAAVDRIVAPPQALTRALGNLLQNSQRYAKGQPVELVAQPAAGGARVGVLDRGPGIPADRVEQMLQPFQRLETSRSRATGGAGLGLAIVKELARANGWTLALSARPGGGLAAWLDLPTGTSAAPAGPATHSPPPFLPPPPPLGVSVRSR